MSNINHILSCIAASPAPKSHASFLHHRFTSVQLAMSCHSPKSSSFGPLKYNGSRMSSFIALSAASGDSVGPQKLFVDGINVARKVFDGLPKPVKSFPWLQLVCNLQNLILELVMAVLKYLSVPLLALMSLSEMSYCAHERKMWVVPVLCLFGFAIAEVLKDAAVELSPELKDGRFPRHLLLIAGFFILLKLPGPYYPYWGRLLIPHFANGGLWRTAWLVFMWYRRTLMKSGETTYTV